MVDRVRVALVDVALEVQAEAPTTTYHAERGALARTVLLDPDSYVRRMVYGVALDPAVQAAATNATDAQLRAAVVAIWNAYSVVTRAPGPNVP